MLAHQKENGVNGEVESDETVEKNFGRFEASTSSESGTQRREEIDMSEKTTRRGHNIEIYRRYLTRDGLHIEVESRDGT